MQYLGAGKQKPVNQSPPRAGKLEAYYKKSVGHPGRVAKVSELHAAGSIVWMLIPNLCDCFLLLALDLETPNPCT